LISTAEITPGLIWVKIVTQIPCVHKVSNHKKKEKKFNLGIIYEITEKSEM